MCQKHNLYCVDLDFKNVSILLLSKILEIQLFPVHFEDFSLYKPLLPEKTDIHYSTEITKGSDDKTKLPVIPANNENNLLAVH